MLVVLDSSISTHLTECLWPDFFFFLTWNYEPNCSSLRYMEKGEFIVLKLFVRPSSRKQQVPWPMLLLLWFYRLFIFCSRTTELRLFWALKPLFGNKTQAVARKMKLFGVIIAQYKFIKIHATKAMKIIR